MKNKHISILLVLASIFTSSCDAVLQNIQKSQQAQTAANQAAGKAPKRAYTLIFPANKDRIPVDNYAAGDEMKTNPNPANTRYKDYVFTNFDISTEYYKKGAPNWDGSKKDLVLDIIKPRNDAAKNRPCFVFLFGGGFVGKIDDCTQEVCKGMVQKGYVVIAADYRVGFKNGLLSGQCIGDFNTGFYPAYFRAIQDSRSVVRYLKANADRLGIDKNLIFVGGQSAGALASIGLAVMNNDNAPQNILQQIGGSLDPMNDNMQFDSKVAGIVSMSGAIIDPTLIVDKKLSTPMNFITGTCDELIDMYVGAPFKCQDQKNFPNVYGGAAIYEAAIKNKNAVYLNLICNGGHGMGSVGYNQLIDLISNYTYSIINGNPIVGKTIITAVNGVCTKQNLCK